MYRVFSGVDQAVFSS